MPDVRFNISFKEKEKTYEFRAIVNDFDLVIPIYIIGMKEGETHKAAVQRLLEGAFAEEDLDSLDNEIGDLRREYEQHEHGGPT